MLTERGSLSQSIQWEKRLSPAVTSCYSGTNKYAYIYIAKHLTVIFVQ